MNVHEKHLGLAFNTVLGFENHLRSLGTTAWTDGRTYHEYMTKGAIYLRID